MKDRQIELDGEYVNIDVTIHLITNLAVTFFHSPYLVRIAPGMKTVFGHRPLVLHSLNGRANFEC